MSPLATTALSHQAPRCHTIVVHRLHQISASLALHESQVRIAWNSMLAPAQLAPERNVWYARAVCMYNTLLATHVNEIADLVGIPTNIVADKVQGRFTASLAVLDMARSALP